MQPKKVKAANTIISEISEAKYLILPLCFNVDFPSQIKKNILGNFKENIIRIFCTLFGYLLHLF